MEQTIVVVPQAIELQPFVRSLATMGYRGQGLTVGRLNCTSIDGLGLVCAVGGHGKTQLAVHSILSSACPMQSQSSAQARPVVSPMTLPEATWSLARPA